MWRNKPVVTVLLAAVFIWVLTYLRLAQETIVSARKCTCTHRDEQWTNTTKEFHDEMKLSDLDNDINHYFIDKDIMSANPIHFSSKFKNPCWFENTTDDTVNRNAGEKFYCLPYFFIAGFAKCASTDVYYRVTAHPEIVSPEGKECHWWTRERFGEGKSMITFKDYLHFMKPASAQILEKWKRNPTERNKLMTVNNGLAQKQLCPAVDFISSDLEGSSED